MQKPATTSHPVHELIAQRWSPRAFSDHPVAAGDVAALLEAARWAPSSMNEQPWRFIVATKEHPDEYAALLDTLVESNQRWAKRAPVLIVVAASTHFARSGKVNRHARYDTGAAVALLSIEATARGLALHQMGGFDRERAETTLGIPGGHEAIAVIAVGHPGDPDALDADTAQRERAPRERSPQEDFVFRGRWGQPAR